MKCVAERTSYFCLARKLIWPLGSTHIFTQWEWLILFNPDHFSGQHQIGEGPPNTLFLRIFRTGQTYFLSALFIAAASQHHEESHLIYGLLESIFLEQGFPIEYEFDEFNLPHTGTPLSRPQLWLCRLWRKKNSLRHPATSSLGNIFWRHASLPQQQGSHIHGWLHHSCP